jgi:hypothetical protein
VIARRLQGNKRLGRRFFIQCEGKVTERDYVAALRQHFKIPREKVVLLSHHGTDPLTIVEELISHRKALGNGFAEGDQMWAIFDVDEHLQNDRPRFFRAIEQAKNHDILLAPTNPSFEYWLCSHFNYHTASIDRKAARAQAQTWLPGYDKALDQKMRGLLMEALSTALENAEKLEKRNAEPGYRDDPYRNPCTSFHHMVNDIQAG